MGSRFTVAIAWLGIVGQKLLSHNGRSAQSVAAAPIEQKRGGRLCASHPQSPQMECMDCTLVSFFAFWNFVSLM